MHSSNYCSASHVKREKNSIARKAIMRIWSLHPQYLDTRGLVALWREALLAQKVLQGNTAGYRHHPQLIRFQACPDPLAAINVYLDIVLSEADQRGFRFNRAKIPTLEPVQPIPVTRGQVDYEWQHLLAKLRKRSQARYLDLLAVKDPVLHPLFRMIEGAVEAWEIIRT